MMESEKQTKDISERKIDAINNGKDSIHDESFMSDSEDKLPKKLITVKETDGNKGMDMDCTNETISSAPVMEEHIHLCHKRIMEYENELKRLQSIVVLLTGTLSNVVNTVQGFQHEAESANESVGGLISGVENASKILQRISIKDVDVDNTCGLPQVESVANQTGSLVIAQDLMENSLKPNPSCGNAEDLTNGLHNDLENMDCKSRTNETDFDGDKTEKTISFSILTPSFDVHDQQSSMDLLQTTTEISEEYLSGFLVKFWQKIGSAVNALNNPDDKSKIFASKEMSNLKASLERDMKELCVYLKRKCELLKQMKLSFDTESKFPDFLSDLEKKLNNQALFTGDLKGEIQESLSDKQKSELINVKEQLGLIIGRLAVKTKQNECINEEQIMNLKKLIVDSSDSNSKCESTIKAFHARLEESGIELVGANVVTVPRTDLDKLHQESEKWKKTSQTLKNVIVDLMEHINNCEEELNGTIVQSILRLSGVSEECDLTDGILKEEHMPRKVHFAPSVLTNILPQHELQGEEADNVMTHLEESSEDLRTELKLCLERLRVEANALLSVSGSLKQKREEFEDPSHLELMDKILLLENLLKAETMEKDRLKVELHASKGLCEGHVSAEAALLARAVKAESQLAAFLSKKGLMQENLEMVAEGIGEGCGPSNFDKVLYKLTQLKEKAQGVLKQHNDREESSSKREDIKADASVVHLIEELCCEFDRLFEEARREKEDLQLQVESADKLLRSTRAFLEEQAMEREQEREEFQRELNQLREIISGRERDKEEKERIIREGKPLASESQDQGIYFPPRLTVEVLEQQCKQLTQLLKDTTSKKDEDEAELKAAVDKIWDLRDIIRELESQVESSYHIEKELRSKNENLITEVAIQKKKLNDLLEELESLRSSLGFNVPSEMENENHTTLLEEALRNHCFQVEQAKALGSSFKEFKKQLLDMGTAIDMKTKELEVLQVTPLTCVNCNSPSEDVSVREQLEQATWRSESPLEDDFSNRDLSGENTSELALKGIASFALPKVPFAELCHLQEKLMRHIQAQEPLLKRMRDLEMQIQTLKQGEEELMTEREVLQSQVEEQLLQASELQARLDEARRRGGHHIHCMPVTPIASLTRSPLGSPSIKTDLPSFCCAGLADARHEIENLTECLEKKELEVTQLRRALEDSKKIVVLQEKELTDRIKEEAETLEKLKNYEQLKADKDALQLKLSNKANTDAGEVPFSLLLDNLFAEKNEEIEFLRLKLINLQEQLSKYISSEDIKSSPQKLKHQNGFNRSNEEKEKSDYSEKSSSGSQEEVEVLRDHGIQRPSVAQLSGSIHQEDHEHCHNLWLHSTKIDLRNSPMDSPGLTFSPLTPHRNDVSVVIEEPEWKEESLEKTPSAAFSYSNNSTSKEKSEFHSEDVERLNKESLHSKVCKDVDTQTTEENTTEALQLAILAKDGEIETLKNKVDELSEQKDGLSQLITELREKIEWHSRHLEKYDEESLGREALIAQVQTEKSELESALQRAEQEVNTWKSSHDKIKDKIESQDEQIENLKAKVDKYCKANKEQHLLLKTAQQERKSIISLLSNLGETGDNRDNESNHLKISTPTSPNGNLKNLVMKLVEQLQFLRTEVSNLIGERNQLKEDLEKAAELQAVISIKESHGDDVNETERKEIEDVNHNSEKLEPSSIQAVRGSSPSLVSLEQMMQKVQQEGIEVLSLSELAIGKRSTPVDTPVLGSPFGSPKSVYSMSNVTSKTNSSVSSLKAKSNNFAEDERVQLLMRIQTLENELSSKEREELRRRDWLEFQEKEALAGWTGMIEAVGQKQRHELSILEQLGQQRNARARLEASVDHLQQQLSQAESEIKKVTYRLGMERSHVIRLESALQQEKCNFSQLQQSLDLERKRANMMKELNLKVSKTLQTELTQYQSKYMYLQKSLKEEHELRMEMEAQVKKIQREQVYVAESAERENLGLDAIANEECRQLRKIEEECERKALEQELESEKQKRIQCQKELLQLRSILESKPKHELYEAGRRWSSSAFPTSACGSDASFNAEDMLQNLKGINQVLGWHLRERDDYQKSSIASVEMEKHYLEAKCCQLEQKLETLQNVMEQERILWANEKSLADQQHLPKLNDDLSHNFSEEVVKFKELVQRLYSLYWRSERNRRSLSWQKQYFLSILSELKILKVDRPIDVSKVSDEEKVVSNITGLGRLHYFNHHSQQKPKSHITFRVLVWTVIATLKMKVLVLRSITGIQVGCRSLLETILLPTLPYNRIQHTLGHQQTKQHYSEGAGTYDMPSAVVIPGSPSSSNGRKNKPVGGIIYQSFP